MFVFVYSVNLEVMQTIKNTCQPCGANRYVQALSTGPEISVCLLENEPPHVENT